MFISVFILLFEGKCNKFPFTIFKFFFFAFLLFSFLFFCASSLLSSRTYLHNFRERVTLSLEWGWVASDGNKKREINFYSVILLTALTLLKCFILRQTSILRDTWDTWVHCLDVLIEQHALRFYCHCKKGEGWVFNARIRKKSVKIDVKIPNRRCQHFSQPKSFYLIDVLLTSVLTTLVLCMYLDF